ncbi:unnamed protein product [Fraxinus pennsylvanica]|uniref:Pyruvate dehydrogenase E1 component subunit beta n=1 Tax=Fraxinus pennsylvanica TaxID=56036 RepID=A0AAD2E7Y1_9LAMI|nr:unnamed protein product [Fraxinus pennsylvanica]
MTVPETLNSALDEEMSVDPKVFLMGEEISKGFLEKYGPNRVVDTPITEAEFTRIGVGAAYYGLGPMMKFMIFNFSTQTALSVVMLEPLAESVAWVQGVAKVKCMALPFSFYKLGLKFGLVHVSRDKCPEFQHHKKAGAMNALVSGEVVILICTYANIAFISYNHQSILIRPPPTSSSPSCLSSVVASWSPLPNAKLPIATSPSTDSSHAMSGQIRAPWLICLLMMMKRMDPMDAPKLNRRMQREGHRRDCGASLLCYWLENR